MVATREILTYGPAPLGERVLRYERLLLIQELQRDHRRKVDMAEALGIPVRTLYSKLQQHGLTSMTALEAREINLGELRP